MITAVDTSTLLDVFLPDPDHAEGSRLLLTRAFDEGALIISDVVYAELVPQFGDRALLDRTLQDLAIQVLPGDRDIAFLAGKRFSEYRREGGPRTRILTDFLIGAHASRRAARLLTRDRGFYRKYFRDVSLLA